MRRRVDTGPHGDGAYPKNVANEWDTARPWAKEGRAAAAREPRQGALERQVVAEEDGDEFVGGRTNMTSRGGDSSLSRRMRWCLLERSRSSYMVSIHVVRGLEVTFASESSVNDSQESF
jgi:hypothetical protein